MHPPFATGRIAAAVALAAVGVALLRPPPVFAYPPPPLGYVPMSVGARVRRSDLVVAGRVITTTIDSTQSDYSATVSVSTTIKGRGPDPLVIEGFGHGHGCKSSVRAGENLLFFVTAKDGHFVARHFKRFDAVAPVTEDNLAEALVAANMTETLFLPLLGLGVLAH